MGNWKKYVFKDIAKFIDYRGRTPKKTERGIPLITAKNVKMGYISEEPREYIATEDYDVWMTRGIPNLGDVLFTTEAPLGNVAELNISSKIALAQRLVTFQPIKGDYISNFLKYYMLSPIFQKELWSKATGTTVKGIKTSILKKFEIPLPPLPEQKRIVAKLDGLFEKIDAAVVLLEENIAHTQALMGSVLDEEFGKLAKKDFEPFLKSVLIQNMTLVPLDTEIYNYVGLENIESETGKLVNFSKTIGKEIKSSKVYFDNGDVLYGKLRPYLNKVWVSNFDGVATTEILPFTPIIEKITSGYLAYYLRSNTFLNVVNANTSGARMPRASARFFKDIAVVPKIPINHQEVIVKKFDKIFQKLERIIKSQTQKLEELKLLKSSLLDQAFKGEL